MRTRTSHNVPRRRSGRTAPDRPVTADRTTASSGHDTAPESAGAPTWASWFPPQLPSARASSPVITSPSRSQRLGERDSRRPGSACKRIANGRFAIDGQGPMQIGSPGDKIPAQGHCRRSASTHRYALFGTVNLPAQPSMVQIHPGPLNQPGWPEQRVDGHLAEPAEPRLTYAVTCRRRDARTSA